MKNLRRYKLNFDKSFQYFQDTLSDTTTLSRLVLDTIDFKSGSFFTLLPEDANILKIYDFNTGGMAANIRREVHIFVLGFLLLNKLASCIFDDVLFSPENAHLLSEEIAPDPLSTYAHLIGNENYYIVNQETASHKIIENCFRISDAIWHSLCIISKINLDNRNININNISLVDFCNASELILVNAYDAESYVIWGRH